MAEERPSLTPRLRKDGSIGLMGHVIADFPAPAAVRSMIKAMAEAGVEVIEIQFPFSEPMADGAYFLAANHQALAQGVDYKACLALAQEVAAQFPKVAFIGMSYLNVVFKRGYARFVNEAREAGLRGVIIPDLPLNFAEVLETVAIAQDFANVRLIAPNVSDARMTELTAKARGLLYAVARSGVTGAATQIGDEVSALVARIRRVSPLPVAVGFGLRTASDIKRLRGTADLAIVGTASLKAFEDSGLRGFQQFWGELAAAALK